jgi:hypothetical protein
MGFIFLINVHFNIDLKNSQINKTSISIKNDVEFFYVYENIEISKLEKFINSKVKNI